MASDSESGHAINVAHLGLVNTAIASMGTTYNPSNPLITALALIAKKEACDIVMTGVTTADVPYMRAVGKRTEAYYKMGALTTRAFGSLESCGASEAVIKNAKGIKNKIEGKRTGKIPVVVPPEIPPVTNSVSQMSFDNRKANFTLFVAILAGEPLYAPNEADITVAALQAYILTLAPLNTTVDETLKVLQEARDTRNVQLYDTTAGVFVLNKVIKKYVKSALGTKSDVYIKFTKIKFTDLQKPKKRLKKKVQYLEIKDTRKLNESTRKLNWDSTKLNKGTTKLNECTTKLNGNITKLNEYTRKLNEDATKLNECTRKLNWDTRKRNLCTIKLNGIPIK